MKKIVLSKSELFNKLKIVNKIIQPNKVDHNLEKLFFELKSGILQVSAADEAGWIKTTIAHNSDCEDFIFSIDAKTFTEGVSRLSEQPITISITEGLEILKVDYSGGNFTLPITTTAPFSTELFQSEDSIKGKIKSNILIDGLKVALPRCATDDFRPVMSGVLMETHDNSCNFVGTNGTSLSLFSSKNVEGDCSVILPRKLCKNLTDIINPDDDVYYSITSNRIEILHSSFSASYRLIEGKYPNYKAVIPNDNTNVAEVEKCSFSSLLKRMILFAQKNSYSLIKLNFKDDKIIGSATDNDFSKSATESISSSFSGEPLEIGFNGEMLLDIINGTSSPEIKILMSVPTKAVLVEEKGILEDIKVLHLIMPVAIN